MHLNAVTLIGVSICVDAKYVINQRTCFSGALFLCLNGILLAICSDLWYDIKVYLCLFIIL